MTIEGAAALVTGGSRGIGQAIVRQLRDAGSRVAVLDLEARDGDGDVALVCDVADEKAVVEGVAAATDRLGGLDLAFLNAGVGGLAPLLAMTAEEWDRNHDVNLRGTFLCLRECARAMVASGSGGSIVITGSVSGFLADRNMAHYNSSKAGVVQLARIAAAELGPRGIRVNVIAPGTTDTPAVRPDRRRARLPRGGERPHPARDHRQRRRRGRRRRGPGTAAMGDRPGAGGRRRRVAVQPDRHRRVPGARRLRHPRTHGRSPPDEHRPPADRRAASTSWSSAPGSPASTPSTACAGSGSRCRCTRPVRAWAAPGSGTAIRAPAATSRASSTRTPSPRSSSRSGTGASATRPSPRSSGTSTTWPTASTSAATSSSTPV